MSKPTSATTTVAPLNSTVRPAVPPVFTAASLGGRPCSISSLKRDTMSSE